MDLSRFQRRHYSFGPTPLQKLERLSRLLDGPEIYIKRDDLLGLSGGGNKTRKLEFAVAEGLVHGADTLITCGAIQSNHCRLTAAAAVKEGIKCRLVLEERVQGSYDRLASGNNLLFHLLGVEDITVVPGGTDMTAAMQKIAAELAGQGRKPWVIPGGAATPVGCLGYVSGAQEIMAQTSEIGLTVDAVVCASGTGSSQAGFLAGFRGINCHVSVIGITVGRKKEVVERIIYELANGTCQLLGLKEEISRDEIVLFDEYSGPGYSLPTPGMIEAVRLLARTEAIVLDPVYTGKAMAGLIDLVRKGYFRKGQRLVFLHSGGAPGLYAQTQMFLS